MESEIEEDWEMVDYNPPSDDSSSKVGMGMGMGRWAVNVGKKVVITGLVLPFVPCLVVISALGLACSVPYGVVYASYACTQKLMSKLLPPPPSEYHELVEEEEKEQPHKEMRIDHLQVEEEQPNQEIRIDHEVVIIEEEEEEDNVVEVEDAGGVGVNQQVEQKEKEKDSLDAPEEKKQLPHFDHVVKNQTAETKDLGQQEKHKNNEKIITEVDKSKQVEKTDDKKQQQRTATAGKRRKTKGKKMAPAEEEEIKGGGGGVAEEKVIVTSVKVEDDSGVRVKYTESTVIATAADVNGKAAGAGGGGGELKQEKAISGTLQSQDQKQESFSDEKIWEKIDAMREIAGFNAPKRDSYFEELKALYLFTGIEAPATSSADTPAEFYTKLAFLMSVIGLK